MAAVAMASEVLLVAMAKLVLLIEDPLCTGAGIIGLAEAPPIENQPGVVMDMLVGVVIVVSADCWTIVCFVAVTVYYRADCVHNVMLRRYAV